MVIFLSTPVTDIAIHKLIFSSLFSIFPDADQSCKDASRYFFGGFKSWYCKDFIDAGDILVEVGFFGDPILEGFGFILFDGGYSGESTNYRREGLEHRWDWGPNENDYSFVIKTDGTGLYYNFSTVSGGESSKPSAFYKCYKR